MVIVMWCLNLVISIFNAWSVGKAWHESRAAGGVVRLMAWLGAVMSACGFTWCYALVLAWGAQATGKLPAKYVDGILALEYLVLIVPILGSGIGITVAAWARAYRERTFANVAVAGWDTFATIYNLAGAFRGVPRAGEVVKGLFDGGDDEDGVAGKLFLFMVLLAAIALAAGIVTTVLIVRHTASGVAKDMNLRYILNRDAPFSVGSSSTRAM